MKPDRMIDFNNYQYIYNVFPRPLFPILIAIEFRVCIMPPIGVRFEMISIRQQCISAVMMMSHHLGSVAFCRWFTEWPDVRLSPRLHASHQQTVWCWRCGPVYLYCKGETGMVPAQGLVALHSLLPLKREQRLQSEFRTYSSFLYMRGKFWPSNGWTFL